MLTYDLKKKKKKTKFYKFYLLNKHPYNKLE